jgi:hypothetical protein
MVDGVKQTTKPIKITYKKPTKTKAGDDYILEAKVDKSLAFIMLILLALFVLNTEYPAILLITGKTTLSLSAFKVKTTASPG